MSIGSASCTRYPLLEKTLTPKDLGDLTGAELSELAEEARAFLIENVCANGGHLGSNLGVVELSIALHRVFTSPADTLLFDTGHQAYVHKMLTGRASQFASLRHSGGISGYPSRAESEHDVIENSHASTALSWADGIAKARQIAGEGERRVVAVVGDGAMTGGMCWEALNNLACGQDRPVIVVLNDNERSYAPTIGGLADHLAALRGGSPDMVDWLVASEPELSEMPGPLPVARSLFELLGLAYLGPVNGHHLPSVEEALRIARDMQVPVVVHVVTIKGNGYGPARADTAEHFHAVGPIDAATGRPRAVGSAPTWTNVFSKALVELGAERENLVAITAAMPGPTGLAAFAERFPERFFDVGIAEQHAVTSAAGLATGGMHPVVAVYATFLGRAFDQVLMDVALHRLGVTFVMDRAGVTGPDGASHHGMWDLTILGAVPGMRVAAPRDAGQLKELLTEAVDYDDGPSALRFAKASASGPIEALERQGPVDILYAGGRDVLFVPVGPLASAALGAARILGTQMRCTVADPRWVLPIAPELVRLASRCRLVITIEENTRAGGFGTALARALQDAAVTTPLRALGLPGRFIPHGSRAELLAEHGLTATGIVHSTLRAHAGLSASQESQ